MSDHTEHAGEVVYAVLVWVDPVAGRDYLAWLEDGHVREVAAFPGIRWARRVRLEQRDDDGWLGILVIYGFEDRAALERYRNSDLIRSFAPVYRRFGGTFRVTRFFGPVEEFVGLDALAGRPCEDEP
ncbi:MAG: DUF4286 family protein [Alphaproteobacteria bacterium]|nr:MAG: DUF4286 family protein [Alphaproteobacteria bacterium]